MTQNDNLVTTCFRAREFNLNRMIALLFAGACVASTALPADAARPIGGGRASPYPYTSQCPNAPAPGAVGR